MQCYAVRLLECQYLNLSFIFIVLPFTYSVPVNLLSSIHILPNSKKYPHTFYTFRLSLLDFLKHFKNSGTSISWHHTAISTPPPFYFECFSCCLFLLCDSKSFKTILSFFMHSSLQKMQSVKHYFSYVSNYFHFFILFIPFVFQMYILIYLFFLYSAP